MARVVALDYGKRRTGIAVTDPLRIIATGLTTVDTTDLLDFLKKYNETEEVDEIVIGQPTRHDGSFSAIEFDILQFIEKLREQLPHWKLHRINEMYTSREAMKSLIQSGVPKMKRRDKKLLDRTAATILLQEFLAHNT